ncbi:MAG TPA: hypothetical protein PLU80_11275, partial [Acidobacteriota bacterium]|nr:hypothetical protein [Acidobacteriota bacterium]
MVQKSSWSEIRHRTEESGFDIWIGRQEVKGPEHVEKYLVWAASYTRIGQSSVVDESVGDES